MEMRIRRENKDIPLPEYKTAGAAAMDCAVREDVTIAAKSVGYVSLNVSIEPPPGHFILMAARSSLHKRGLMFANGVAIFDQDYCGDADEYKAILYNFTDEAVEVKQGERVGQIILMPYDRIAWNEVDSLNNTQRGGIGSTGL
jgi:dUTP pyrophosphatase